VLTLGLASCTPATQEPPRQAAGKPLTDFATTAKVLENVKAAESLQTVPPSVAKKLTADDFVHFGPGFECTTVDNPSEADYYGACAYGDPNGRKLMVLYGDSHVDMWYAPLERIAAQTGWKLRVFGQHACPAPEMHFHNPNTDRPDDRCDIFHSRAPTVVQALHPNLVITTSISNWTLADGSSPTPAQWTDAWVTTLNKLAHEGTRLALIGDTPYWKQNDARCLAANIEAVQECSAPTAEATPQRVGAEQAAAEAVGALYIPTIPWICGDRCEPVIADRRVFADYSHVSASYATYLTGAMNEALQTVLVL
jgi:hypothetical protein